MVLSEPGLEGEMWEDWLAWWQCNMNQWGDGDWCIIPRVIGDSTLAGWTCQNLVQTISRICLVCFSLKRTFDLRSIPDFSTMTLSQNIAGSCVLQNLDMVSIATAVILSATMLWVLKITLKCKPMIRNILSNYFWPIGELVSVSADVTYLGDIGSETVYRQQVHSVLCEYVLIVTS